MLQLNHIEKERSVINMQSDTVVLFDELRQDVLNLISNSDTYISSRTSCKDAGIYLLYVDNFDDEKIIPFYIGKTVNFQKRFSDHIRDLKALTKFRYSEYHNKFFWSAASNKRAFEGKYRPCKILKYILDHDCSFDDVKMVVLEKCKEEYLLEREQYYLYKYLPAFFGFNQIATITEQFIYRNDPEKKKDIIGKDLKLFEKYVEYGYSTFNYLHAFAGYGSLEIDERVNKLLSNNLWPSQKELFSRSYNALKKYNELYEEAYTQISDRFASEIHNIFERCKFKSKEREKEVLSVFTNHFRAYIIDDVDEHLDYLEYYFNRDKKSRECGRLIKELYVTHADEIGHINTPVMMAFEEYIVTRKQAIEQSRFSIIFPNKRF